MSRASVELLADSRQVRRATDDLRQLEARGQSTTNVVGGLRRAFVALGAAAVIGKTIQSVTNFNQAIADLSAITGAAGADLEFYREQASEIGRTTSLSASQAADAFKLIASAQPQLLESADALAAVTREAVTLAEATGIALPEAASALGSALNQFQLDSGRASEVINILAASSQLGTAEVANVTEALRNAGSAANSLGVDFAETVAGIQGLAAAGRQGADAGTALRQVMLRLEQTGNSALQPSVVGLTGALQELRNQNLNNIELMELFGQEAFTAATALLAQTDTVSRLNVTLRGTNTAAEQAATRMNTLRGDFLQLQSAIEGLQIAVFNDDVDSMGRSLVQAATDGVNTLSENIDTLGTAALGLSAIIGARVVSSLVASTTASIAATAAQKAEAQAAFFAAQGYRTKALALNQVTASTIATTAATTAATRAFALLGGSAGVVALTAFGIYRLSQSYRDGLQAQDDRVQRIVAEHKAQQELNKELRAAGLLFEDTAKATAAGATAMQRYQESVTAAYAAEIQGMSQSQIQEEFDNVSASLESAERRLQRVSERFAEGTLRYQQAEEAVRVLREQLGLLGGIYPTLTTSNDQAAESLRKVTQSLEDQIYELVESEQAYELLIATRQAGVALDSEEAAGIRELIAERNKLAEAIRAETEAEREADRFGQRATDLGNELNLELGGEEARIEDQYFERLSIIDNALAMERLSKEEHRQLELQAEEAYQQRLTQLEAEAAEDRAKQVEQINSARMQAEKALQSQALSLAQNSFGAIADVVKQAKGEESAAYKIAYAAQQAAAIAMAYINTESAAIAAMAPPPVGLGPVAGAPYAQVIRGLGYASIGIMAGQTIGNLAGARALGGQVIGGNQYLVGERGPELVTMGGNGNVTPFNQLKREASQASSAQVMVNVNNYGNDEVRTEARTETLSNGQRREVLEIIVGDIRNRGRVPAALGTVTNVKNRAR